MNEVLFEKLMYNYYHVRSCDEKGITISNVNSESLYLRYIIKTCFFSDFINYCTNLNEVRLGKRLMRFGRKHIYILLNTYENYKLTPGLTKTADIRVRLYGANNPNDLALRKDYQNILRNQFERFTVLKFIDLEILKYKGYRSWAKRKDKIDGDLVLKQRKSFLSLVVLGNVHFTTNGVRLDIC